MIKENKRIVIIIACGIAVLAISGVVFLFLPGYGLLVNFTKHTISIEQTEGFEIVSLGGDFEVKENTDFEFNVNVDSNFLKDFMVVNAGGKVLTPNASGVYTISSVYVDTTITVTGLVFIESATVFGYSNYFDEYNVNLGLQITGFSTTGTLSRANIAFPKTVGGNNIVAIAENAFAANNTLVSIVLREGMLDIGNNAFYGCTSLEEIFIPATTTNIGNTAFLGATALERVHYSTSDVDLVIGNSAFRNCTSLIEAVIPSNAVSIGTYLFAGCNSLETVDLNNEVYVDSEYAFANCTSLASATISEPLTVVPAFCFFGSENLLNIENGNITEIKESAFSGCSSLMIVNFPGSLITIQDSAFYGCSSLATAEFSFVSTIGDSAFYGCTTLSSVDIVSSIISIGNRAFALCDNLATVNFADYGNLQNIGNYAFAGKVHVETELVGLGNKLSNISLPANLLSLGDYAFAYSNLLETVSVSAVSVIGNSAFADCPVLSSVTFANGITSIGNYAFYNCPAITSLVIPSSMLSIGRYAFAHVSTVNNSQLSSITINANSLAIDQYAFYNCGSLGINDLSGVDSIGNYAFSNSGITAITIPSTVEIIGTGAFLNCSSLATLIIQENVTTINSDAFKNCTALTNLTISSTISTIGSNAFQNTAWLSNQSSNDFVEINNILIAYNGDDTEVIVPSGIITINSYAFLDVEITKVTLPTSIQAIEANAFVDCGLLTNISMNALTPPTLGVDAFIGCASNFVFIVPEESFSNYRNDNDVTGWVERLILKVFPSSYHLDGDFLKEEDGSNIILKAYIGTKADVVVPMGITHIDAAVFYNLDVIETISFSIDGRSNLVFIGDFAFYGCDNLENVMIPQTVTYIGRYSFAMCDNLESISFAGSPTIQTIGDFAFASSHYLINEGSTVTDEELETWDFNYTPAEGEEVMNSTLYESISTILDGEITFGTSSFISIIVPNSVTSLGDGVFMGTNLSDFNMPTAIETLGESIFAYCSQLETFTFNSIITEIGERAFSNCNSLEGVTFEASLNIIAAYAFDSCSSLENAILISGIETIGDYAFYNCTSLISTGINGYFFPTTVLSIGEYSYANCTSLTYVSFSSSSSSGLEEISKGAFSNCTSLEFVGLGAINIIGDYAFFNDNALMYANFSGSAQSVNVETIGDYAYSNTSIVNVSFGTNVVSIGDYAFSECSLLKTVLLGSNSLISIGNYAFYLCEMLNTVTTNNATSLQTIGDYAFGGRYEYVDLIEGGQVVGSVSEKLSNRLTSIILPDSVQHIGEGAFFYNNMLETVRIGQTTGGNSIMTIGDYAFALCGTLNAFEFRGSSNALAEIGNYALAMAYYDDEENSYRVNANLETIIMPNGSYTLGDYAFSGATELESINFGSSIESIGNYAFYDCSDLLLLSLPSTITSIGSSAFENCHGLVTIDLNFTNATIADKAFFNCSGLTSIEIGSGIISIGETAFGKASNLAEFIVNSSNANYSDIGGILFNKTGTSLIQYPTRKTASSYEVARIVTSIEAFAFLNSNMLSAIIFEADSQLATIGESAFNGCSNIITLHIPESIESIGDRAFYNCTSITNIRILASTPPDLGEELFENVPINAIYVETSSAVATYNAAVTESGWTDELKAILYCYDLLENGFLIDAQGTLLNYSGDGGDIELPDEVRGIDVVAIGNNVFRNQNITGISGGDNITSIGMKAFYGTAWLDGIKETTYIGSVLIKHSNQKIVTIPSYVTGIYDKAFSDCYLLEEITLNDGLKEIGYNAFNGLIKLQSVKIPSSVTNIASGAFMNCIRLTGIEIEASTPPTLGEYVFSFSPVQAIYVPNGGKLTYQSAWSGFINDIELIYAKNIRADGTGYAIYNDNLVHYYGVGGNLSIPATITGISAGALSYNTKIASINIPSTVNSIGERAFYNCTSLNNITFQGSKPNIMGDNIYSNTDIVAVYVPSQYITTYNTLTTNGWDNDIVFSSSDLFGGFLYKEIDVDPSEGVNNKIVLINYSGTSQHITIPTNIKYIGANAFAYNNTVKTITISRYIEYIDKTAFIGCSDLLSFSVATENTYFAVHEGVLYSKVASSKNTLLHYPDAKAGAIYSVPNEVQAIGDYAFSGVQNLISISIENNIHSIGDYAFHNMDSLSSVTISGIVDSIGKFAFAECSELSDLTINNGVLSISERAFYKCNSLTQVSLPNSLQSLGKYAFEDCSNLAEVVIGSGITTIAEGAFYNCNSINSISFLGDVPPIVQQKAFMGNASIGYQVLPSLNIWVPNGSYNTYLDEPSFEPYQNNIFETEIFAVI